MPFVVCEPGEGIGGGIFHGVCLGLVFCYSGPGSDVPVSEVALFEERKEAEDCRNWIIQEAKESSSKSLRILQAMEVVEITPGMDLEALALEWHMKSILAGTIQ